MGYLAKIDLGLFPKIAATLRLMVIHLVFTHNKKGEKKKREKKRKIGEGFWEKEADLCIQKGDGFAPWHHLSLSHAIIPRVNIPSTNEREGIYIGEEKEEEKRKSRKEDKKALQNWIQASTEAASSSSTHKMVR